MKDSTVPRISVITVCYNAELFLREAIESVVSQQYENKEYIIIDGGSTDKTLEIIHDYKQFVDVLVSEPDKGISDAFNKGIALASGDLIGICNADDKLTENALCTIASFYKEGVDIFRFQEYVVNKSMTKKILLSPTPIPIIPIHTHLLHMGCWITKEAYKKYGTYDLSFKYCMDYELIRRFIYNGAKECYCLSPVGYFRGGGVSQSGDKQIEKEKIEICRRYGGLKWGGYIWVFYERIRAFIKKYFYYFFR